MNRPALLGQNGIPQAPQMVISAPFNDMQLLALMASSIYAGCSTTAREAADAAIELMAQVIHDGVKRVNARVAELAKE